MTLDWRKRRIAQNEASFRDINDRLEQGLRHVDHGEGLQEFLCECGDRNCEAHIRLSFDEYEAVRRDSRRFAVVPGHVYPETERVVHAGDRYEVVEKCGPAVDVADEADSRLPGERGRRDGDPAP